MKCYFIISSDFAEKMVLFIEETKNGNLKTTPSPNAWGGFLGAWLNILISVSHLVSGLSRPYSSILKIFNLKVPLP